LNKVDEILAEPRVVFKPLAISTRAVFSWERQAGSAVVQKDLTAAAS
jgi:hypothetical protein